MNVDTVRGGFGMATQHLSDAPGGFGNRRGQLVRLNNAVRGFAGFGLFALPHGADPVGERFRLLCDSVRQSAIEPSLTTDQQLDALHASQAEVAVERSLQPNRLRRAQLFQQFPYDLLDLLFEGEDSHFRGTRRHKDPKLFRFLPFSSIFFREPIF